MVLGLIFLFVDIIDKIKHRPDSGPEPPNIE